MCFRVEKDVLTWVALQKLFATFVVEHAHQSIVDFDETSVGAAEEQSLLNVVKQFAVTAFGFATIGDVLEYVDRLQAFAAGGVHLGSGDQERASQRRVDVFVNQIFRVAAE